MFAQQSRVYMTHMDGMFLRKGAAFRGKSIPLAAQQDRLDLRTSRFASSATGRISPTTLPEFLDEVENTIKRSDCGKLSSSKIGGLVKPPPGFRSSGLVNTLKAHDRFVIEVKGREVFISLAKNTTTSENPRSEKAKPVGNNKNAVSAYPEYTYLTDIKSLRATVTEIMNGGVEKQFRNGETQKVVAIDLEGKYRIELIQIATRKMTYIIDCRLKGGAKGVLKLLEGLLSSKKVIKLMHDISRDTNRISCAGGKRLRGVLDTQVVARMAFQERNQMGMNRFLDKIGVPSNSLKDEMHEEFFKQGKTPWKSRPLAKKSLAYAALDVACLLESHRYIWKKFTDEEITSMLKRSER